MSEEIDIFGRQYNILKNSKGGRLSSQRDFTIRDNTFTELSNIASKHDKPDYISGRKTFNAVVVYDYPKSSPAVAGTNLEGMLSALGDTTTDNLLQVRAIVPDAHDLINPIPNDLSKQSVKQSGEQQKYLSLAPVFQSTGQLNGSLTVGSIIEVEYSDDEYSEGRIVSIVKSTSIFEAAAQSAKKLFDDVSQGISSLFDSGIQSGDSENVNNLTTLTEGQCGGIGNYAVADCKTAALTTTGQTVTLHPDFWEQVDQLVTQIYNDTGIKISVNGSTRSVNQQINLRKSKCPEWSLLLSTKTENEIMSISWSSMNNAIKAINGKGCSQQTPVGAAYGSSTSNHLKGLAIDLKMDINCPSSTSSQSGWQNCRNTSKVFNSVNKYASSYNIKNYNVEPWHWSWNGG